MSWKATAWALRQTTGAARCKLVLLALASYAKETGDCWPSQETLARDTEQSVDTVQRQLRVLEKLKLLERARVPKRRGQWQGHRYKLLLPAGEILTEPKAARPTELRPGQAAISSATRPQSLRLKPSKEPSREPSPTNMSSDCAERIRSFQGKHEGIEIIQNRIARRIGNNGWLVLGEMNDSQRSRLSTLERQGRLDDEALMNAVLQTRLGGPR